MRVETPLPITLNGHRGSVSCMAQPIHAWSDLAWMGRWFVVEAFMPCSPKFDVLEIVQLKATTTHRFTGEDRP